MSPKTAPFRRMDPSGRLVCAIARPMIDFYLDLLNASPNTQRLVDRFNVDWNRAKLNATPRPDHQRPTPGVRTVTGSRTTG
jgi:hypothetical protein